MENLRKIGKVGILRSREIDFSPIGIGFEKLDRGLFNPEGSYELLGDLGVKWVRIQSGWNRTETEKEVYNYSWLDRIVDRLIRHGMKPWLCLCYGNRLYDPAAAENFGGAGCPPRTEEAKKAWCRYVRETVSRYRGKISFFEIWNEPDGVWCWKHGPDGREYGEFLNLTAAAVREADPKAKIIGGAICRFDLQWIADMLETGAGKNMDYLSYHGYNPDERIAVRKMRAVRALCRKYNPDIGFIEGENGAQSCITSAGALYGASWNPRKQAKLLARMMLLNLFNGAYFCSYFSCMDMAEGLNGKTGNPESIRDYAAFGVLSSHFNAYGIAEAPFTPKSSYRTLQVLCSIFGESFEFCELPAVWDKSFVNGFPQAEPSWEIRRMDDSPDNLIYQGIRKRNGSSALVYWTPKELLTTEYSSVISLEICEAEGAAHLVDILDGSIYELPSGMEESRGKNLRIFHHIPLKDHPLMLAFGDFFRMDGTTTGLPDSP